MSRRVTRSKMSVALASSSTSAMDVSMACETMAGPSKSSSHIVALSSRVKNTDPVGTRPQKRVAFAIHEDELPPVSKRIAHADNIDRSRFERRIQNRVDGADIPPNLLTDIYEYQLWLETRYLLDGPVLPESATTPESITARHRTILVDWLLQVHDHEFRCGHLAAETLYLVVHLLDTYLNQTGATKSDLQLVGVAALFAASKYEEIYAPEITELVDICEKAITGELILKYEKKLLTSVNFELQWPSPLVFISMYETACRDETIISKTHISLAKCLADCFLLSPLFATRLPSHVALSGLAIAHNLIEGKPFPRDPLACVLPKIDWNSVNVTSGLMVACALRYARHPRYEGWRNKYFRHTHGSVGRLPTMNELVEKLRSIDSSLFV